MLRVTIAEYISKCIKHNWFMNNLKIKKESFPKRCDICHQSDEFDPITNNCNRCSTKSKLSESKLVENVSSFNKFTSESLFEPKAKPYLEKPKDNLQKLAIECFYHPNTSVVGMCKVCQRAICRNCVNKIHSSILLCKNCKDPNQAEFPIFIFTFLGIILILMIAGMLREC